MSTPARRSLAPVAPEKGSFPLDHEGECKHVMRDFLKCLKVHGNSHGPCKNISKAYLECRMERGLMKREPFDKLGFNEAEEESKRNQEIESQERNRSIISASQSGQDESNQGERNIEQDKRGTSSSSVSLPCSCPTFACYIARFVQSFDNIHALNIFPRAYYVLYSGRLHRWFERKRESVPTIG